MWENYLEEHLIECKKKLYAALLHKPVNEYTKSDTDLGMVLAEDPDIQAVLERGRKGGQ